MTNFENQKDEILKALAINGNWCIWDDGTIHSCYEFDSCNKCKFITYKDRGCKNEKRFWLDEECEQQSSDKSDESEDRWIPVTERLPENSLNKLVTFKYDFIDPGETLGVGTAHYMYGNWYYSYANTIVSGRVIAWKPLPHPYREERR